MVCKGSSNFISPPQQAVSQLLLELDNADLETVLHWKGGNIAADCGQELEVPRHHNQRYLMVSSLQDAGV